jgi:exonuclease III
MTENTIYLSILILNINDLNSSIKRYQVVSWFKKYDLTICCLQEMCLTDRTKYWLIMKRWEKILYQMDPKSTKEYLY